MHTIRWALVNRRLMVEVRHVVQVFKTNILELIGVQVGNGINLGF
jgi:hypothetical protein